MFQSWSRPRDIPKKTHRQWFSCRPAMWAAEMQAMRRHPQFLPSKIHVVGNDLVLNSLSTRRSYTLCWIDVDTVDAMKVASGVAETRPHSPNRSSFKGVTMNMGLPICLIQEHHTEAGRTYPCFQSNLVLPAWCVRGRALDMNQT